MFESTRAVTKPLFREMVVSGSLSLGDWPPIMTGIVVDGIMSFAIDVAKEMGIMSVSFRTIIASCTEFIFVLLDSLKQASCPSKVFDRCN